MSLDGVISKGEHDQLKWGGSEDKKFYKQLTEKIKYLIVGENTFKTLPQKAFENRYYIVLCKNSSKYKESKNKEFFSGEIDKLLKILETRGIKEVGIVGGRYVYKSFLEKKLVDEIYLTIAPFIFGAGLKLFEKIELEINLKLLKTIKLSPNLVVLKYKVI